MLTLLTSTPPLQSSVVSSTNHTYVVGLPHMSMEEIKLDSLIAQDVRIGGSTTPIPLQELTEEGKEERTLGRKKRVRLPKHLIPVFLDKVNPVTGDRNVPAYSLHLPVVSFC